MKPSFRLFGTGAHALALLAALAVFGAAARAQTASATPDSVVVQIANTVAVAPFTPAPSPSPTPVATTARQTYAQDVDGTGRFVVIESTGDIATERTNDTFDSAGNLVSRGRNNQDGNVEIFLFDYAQRRIFQITNTRSDLVNAALSPADPANVEVDVRNLRPMISHDGRYIVFASNAYSDADASLTPKNFDGNAAANSTALKADGNMEIFVYRIPDVAAVNLSAGDEVPFVDLTSGAMTRVTNTPASRVPTPGTSTVSPFVADDNRAATLNDDGSYVAFISTRNITNVGGVSNADGNPEVFVWVRTGASFVQVTNTSGLFTFNDNPSLSGDGAVLVFYSNADINTTEATAARGNGEVYAASFNGSIATNVRPLTQTATGTNGLPVNVLRPGRRLSRNGQFVAFESTAVFGANGAVSSLSDDNGGYVIRLSDNSFTLVVPRAPSDQLADVFSFPTFTGDSTQVVFASSLNFRATTGEVLAAESTDGLNTSVAARRPTQVFAVSIPAPGAAAANYRRLTRLPGSLGGFETTQPFPSDTLRRLAFTVPGEELGGGNSDGSQEAYYLIVPDATSEASSPTVSFSTGASDRPVVAASPAPTPPAVTGLAAGMLGIARSALQLAPSARQVSQNNATESGANARRPPLPVELNGVTVTVSGYGAGLYFVSPGQINFVVPPGLQVTAAASAPVVINNNGTVIRTSVVLNPAQPDVFTSTNSAGGRAAVLNVTNACISPTGEPFSITTTRPTGNVCTATTTETVPTELLIMVTGVRPVNATSAVTVRIGTTDITGTSTTAGAASIVSVGPSRTHGFDQIIVRLPAGFAERGDLPVIVTVTAGGTTFTSRPADTAPRITIQ